MKALEKAAQDRDKTPAATAHSSTQSVQSGLSLETVEVKPAPSTPARLQADEDTSRVDMPQKRAAAAPPYTQYTPPLAANKAAARAASAATVNESTAAASSNAQTRAATVLNAQAAPAAGSGALANLMARPVYLIGALAGLIMLGYAAYVYIQIAHPSLLIKSPSRAPAPASAPVAAVPTPAAPVPAPVPASAEPMAAGAPQPADTTPGMVTLQSVFNSRAGSPGTVVASGDAPPLAAAPAPSGTISAGSTSPAAKPAAPPPASPASPTPLLAPRVAVSSGDTATPRVNAMVSEAYAALQTRQFDTAQRLYSQVVRSEPGNVDALLGLASIAQYDNRPEDAQRHFMAILDVEPRNALAQSGLVALMSRADPQAAETRLKQLLARDPSAPL